MRYDVVGNAGQGRGSSALWPFDRELELRQLCNAPLPRETLACPWGRECKTPIPTRLVPFTLYSVRQFSEQRFEAS